MDNSNLLIYTDGASRGNPGVGSWAFVVYNHPEQYLGSKSRKFENQVTNNFAELFAINEALLHVLQNTNGAYAKLGNLSIHSDSSYCVNIMSDWIHGWARNNWKKKTPGEIQNLGLIKQLYANLKAVEDHGVHVAFFKVPGHAGVEGNEKADELCNMRLDE